MRTTFYSRGITKAVPVLSVRDLLCILCCIFSCSGLAQIQLGDKPVAANEITIAMNTGVRMYRGLPFTGEAVTYYASGQIAKLEQFEAGRRDGFLRQWYENKVLAFDSHYVAGRLEGQTTSWWKNGNLRSVSPYVEGRVTGESKQWYVTGELFKKMHYIDGQEVGLQQAWRQNGKLYSNYHYINGRVFGLKRSNMCVGLEDEKVVKAD